MAQILDVGLALYAVGFFASLAGMAGAYFVERNGEARQTLTEITERSAAPLASTGAAQERVAPADRPSGASSG